MKEAKRSVGRPKLTAKQREERKKKTRIAFDMRPEQVELLEKWIEQNSQNSILTLTGRSWSKASAVNYLVMKSLIAISEGSQAGGMVPKC